MNRFKGSWRTSPSPIAEDREKIFVFEQDLLLRFLSTLDDIAGGGMKRSGSIHKVCFAASILLHICMFLTPKTLFAANGVDPDKYPHPLREAVAKQYFLLSLRYLDKTEPPTAVFAPRDELVVSRTKANEGNISTGVELKFEGKVVCRLEAEKKGRMDVFADLEKVRQDVARLVKIKGDYPETINEDNAIDAEIKHDPLSLIKVLNAIDKRLLVQFNKDDLLNLARVSALLGHTLNLTYDQPAWFYGTAIAAADLANVIWGDVSCRETLAFCLALSGRQADAIAVLGGDNEKAASESEWGRLANALSFYDPEYIKNESNFLAKYFVGWLEGHDNRSRSAVEAYKELLQEEPSYWLAYIGINAHGVLSDRHITTNLAILYLLSNPEMWRYFQMAVPSMSSDLEPLLNAFVAIAEKIDSLPPDNQLISNREAYFILNSCLQKSVADRMMFLGYWYASAEAAREFMDRTKIYLGKSSIGQLINAMGLGAVNRYNNFIEIVKKLDSRLDTLSKLSLAKWALDYSGDKTGIDFVLKRKNRFNDANDDRIQFSLIAWGDRKYWSTGIKEAKEALRLSPYDHRCYQHLKGMEYTQPWEKRGIEKLPNSYAMRINAGEYFYGSVVPRYAQAEPFFKEAIDIYPYGLKPYSYLIKIYEYQREVEKVKATMEAYLNYDSESLGAVEIKCDLADIYMKEGLLGKAYKQLKEAVVSWKGDALSGFAHVNERLGRLDEATIVYQQLAQRYPKYSTDNNAYFLLRNDIPGGRVLLEAEIETCEAAIESGIIGYADNVAGYYAVLGEFEKAKKFFEMAVQNGGNVTFEKIMLGVVAYELGDIEKAKSIFKSISSSGGNKETFRDLLPVLQGKKNPADFLEKVPSDSSETNIYFFLHYVFLLRGDSANAVECLKRCVRSTYPNFTTWNMAYQKLKAMEKLTPDFWYYPNENNGFTEDLEQGDNAAVPL